MTRYNKTHEWARLEDQCVVVGISEYAVSQLGDVIFVELPAVGHVCEANQEIAVVESVKAASDVYAPVAGKVVSVNTELANKPELVNESAEDQGWLFKIEPSHPDEMEALLSKKDYEAVCAE